MKINETKIWSASRVRSMCVRHGYYTAGDSESYGRMLTFVEMRKPTKENIYRVAEIIAENSDLASYGVSKIENIEGIMFDITNECVSVHYEIKGE